MYRFIYPSKDAYIYELKTNDEKNFGSDDTLVLKKDFSGIDGLNGVSRILLKFDFTEISKSIVSGDISNPNYYLRLYEKDSSELSLEYQLNAYALSQSWEEGTGYTTQDPNSRNGVSWEKSDERLSHLSWSAGGISSVEISMDSASKPMELGHPHLDTGNRKTGGGIWYDEGGIENDIASVSSQSFSNQSPNIEMNVTDIVNRWVDGTRQNEGFIIKWDTNDSNLNSTSQSQEDSTSITGDINFYSIDAQSIFSPKVEVRWDDHLPCTGSNTGSLTQITIDGTKDNYLYMINLKKTYKETETPKFRIGGRERYQTKTVSTTKSTTSPLFVPEGSGSYSIIDVGTGETLVPFGDNSLLSCDSKSNYFKLNMKEFITNKSYKIKIRIQLDDGRYNIFDDNFNFKVVN
jgi:hypothetical protein